MTEETAKLLAEAMNRLAAAIESLRGGNMLGGIQVHHHGIPSNWTQPQQYYGGSGGYIGKP